MNLFRSEEDARRWSLFDPGSEAGFISLPDLLVLFSTESRRHLLGGDYLERWASRRWPERRDALQQIAKTNPYWMPVAQ
jgi:hypothetical protein